jgi:hypothetical protein
VSSFHQCLRRVRKSGYACLESIDSPRPMRDDGATERGINGQAQHLLDADALVLVQIFKLGREIPGAAVLDRFSDGHWA